MTTIYEPKGKAREYSPYALNLYLNCDHQCLYCYVRVLFNQAQYQPVQERKGIIEQLKKDAPKFSNKGQILLSFTGDPYCKANDKFKLTRQALKILLENNCQVAILTKGGERCLQDLDLFKQFKHNIKVGATLTFTQNDTSKHYEPGATLPKSRYIALKVLHDNGIKTFVSLEPVIIASETIKIIEETHTFVDQYKIGLTNYFKTPMDIDWSLLLHHAIDLFEKYDKDYYIKQDLQKYNKRKINKKYLDQNYLVLKPNSLF